MAKRDCGFALFFSPLSAWGLALDRYIHLLEGSEGGNPYKTEVGCGVRTYFKKCLFLYAESFAVHGDIIVSEGEM